MGGVAATSVRGMAVPAMNITGGTPVPRRVLDDSAPLGLKLYFKL
jgi:hypothetical protein